MSNTQIDRLDKIAQEVAQGRMDAFGAISTGEAVYVALAANRADLLGKMDFTIAEALVRVGPEWVEELVARWQYKGDPRRPA